MRRPSFNESTCNFQLLNADPPIADDPVVEFEDELDEEFDDELELLDDDCEDPPLDADEPDCDSDAIGK